MDAPLPGAQKGGCGDRMAAVFEDPVCTDDLIAVGGQDWVSDYGIFRSTVADSTVEGLTGCEHRPELFEQYGSGSFVQPISRADSRVIFTADGQQRNSVRRCVEDDPASFCIDALFRHGKPFVLDGMGRG